ncbi:NYN domain-containing protein [Clostridium sp. HBUAS56010]|uniref:NYN domain-containing protein n=1 Tax=Clostridium sp. HBUAS56010 TaxID=2571127 RepID=UPI00163DCA82|nr:NYN domain-containing protein [Clostridium sp. HBUAS56010]
MGKMSLDEDVSKKVQKEIKDTSNVCILIDYDNLFYTMKRYAIDVTDDEYNICEYFNNLYGKDKIRSFRAYADFEQVKVSLRKLQEQRVQIRNVYGNNKDDKYRKNASDIELSIDAIESTYKDPNIDTYAIVTSDSDMIPIMSRLKYKGKQVHLYFTSQNASQTTHFESYCDSSCDLLKLFKVDTEKGKPEYWFECVKDIIVKWYGDPKNKTKTLGFGWAKTEVANICNISDMYALEIINIMLEKKILIRKLEEGKSTYISLP